MTLRDALPRRLPSLAVLDWGIGGFGLVTSLVRAAPGASFVYLSDAGFTPYGRLPARALRDRIVAIAVVLAARGVTHLVLACNAASTVADDVRRVAPLHVLDVVTHGLRVAAVAKEGTIGVVGGARTIRSGVYRRGLVARGKVVRQRIAQPLSGRIERGDLSSPALDRDLARIVHPLRGVGALLLGCTHYPAIAPRFRAHLPGVRLLDPAGELLREVLRLGPPRTGQRIFLTTGDAAATRAGALRAFGIDPGAVRRIAMPTGA